MSDGQTIDNPRFFRSEEKELAKAQRKFSRAEKGTSERKKRRKVVARVHERISFKRTNFSHQQSRKIVNGNGFIAVEDLQVNRMVHNHCLAKSIQDAAWSNFFSMLFCKAEEAGRIAVKVNPAFTSHCDPFPRNFGQPPKGIRGVICSNTDNHNFTSVSV
jgi:putative transposase